MASSPTNPTPMRENEVNLLKEVHGIFDKFLKCLVGIIAFKVTDMGQHFFETHPYMMMALVLAAVVSFSAWLLVTILQLHVSTFHPFVTCIVLTIGVISSAFALIFVLLPPFMIHLLRT